MVIGPEGGEPCVYLGPSPVLVPQSAPENRQPGSDSACRGKSVMCRRAHPSREDRGRHRQKTGAETDS